MRWMRNALLIASVLAAAFGGLGTAWAKRDYAPHGGYLASTQGERDTQIADIVIIQPPKPEGPSLNERIFNDKLVKEFRDRYEEKFGRTEVERVYNSPNRYTYYDDMYGFKGTPQEMSDERRRFGDFVVRRLLEYHVDNYAQNDPKIRPAWEAKEKLKEMKVEIAQFRFDVQYSIAGNTLDVKVNNPYMNLTRVRLQMDPGAFGPAPMQEMIISLGRQFGTVVAIEGHYAIEDGITTFIERRALSPSVGLSVTESTFTKEHGLKLEVPRESKYLAGVSYVF
jgi:hypothetical protein